jgi:hypothetical protein
MEMNLQLQHVVSDITEATGMRIIRAIVAGERDPDVLAGFRDVRCHSSIETIRASVVGNDRDEHIFALTQSLELYDFYHAKVAECDRKLEAAIAALTVRAADDVPAMPKARTKGKQVNAPTFDARRPLRGFGDGRDTDPRPWSSLGTEAGRRMRHRPSGVAERQTLHVLALPCPGQQDIRRQASVFSDPTILQPGRSSLAAGRNYDRAQRHGFGRVLSAIVIPDRQAKGGHGHRSEDRGSVLQQAALWDELPRPRCSSLRRATPNPRRCKPPASCQDP